MRKNESLKYTVLLSTAFLLGTQDNHYTSQDERYGYFRDVRRVELFSFGYVVEKKGNIHVLWG